VTTTADILIIGAGLMGCALAHDLSKKGRSVLVVERGTICSGSSGVNAGGVRQQFTSEVNVRLAARSVERISALDRELEIDVGFDQVGYLFLIAEADTLRVFESAIEVQAACGVRSEMLTPAEVAILVPMVRVDDLLGGAFCASDGHLDPHALVTGFASAARAHGATFRQGCSVVQLDLASDRVVGARTSAGDVVSPEIVINAAGAWSGAIAQMAGTELPIRPWLSQVFRIAIDEAPEHLPMTIDFDHGKTYFHRDGAALLAGNDDGRPADTSWPVSFREERASTLIERLMRRSDAFASARLIGGWAGLLELTPDENPIVGWTGAENLYTAAGFSGHGFSIAPGLSLEVARELCGEETEVDLAPYRPERFDGTAIESEALSLR
jgi:sarcosine oxidase, subunit beta